MICFIKGIKTNKVPIVNHICSKCTTFHNYVGDVTRFYVDGFLYNEKKNQIYNWEVEGYRLNCQNKIFFSRMLYLESFYYRYNFNPSSTFRKIHNDLNFSQSTGLVKKKKTWEINQKGKNSRYYKSLLIQVQKILNNCIFFVKKTLMNAFDWRNFFDAY